MWAPGLGSSFLSRMARARQIVCLGHYANPGMKQPSKSDVEYGVLEVKNSSSIGAFSSASRHLQKIIDRFLPHPARYRLVWSKSAAAPTSRFGGLRVKKTKPLFVWEPIPSDQEYVSLGMICTTSSDPPKLEMVRCVPRQWVSPTSVRPVKVWDDAGTSGRPGSIWRVNSMGLMIATPSHDMPTGPFYDLRADVFTTSMEMEILSIE